MNRYIDADKLKAEIERRAKFHDDAMKACIGLNNIAITHSAGWKEDTELIAIITSLQQEQPEEMDVDFFFDEVLKVYDDNNKYPPRSEEELTMLEIIARHFYELGLRTK